MTSKHTSTVIYPSALFSLERDEVYPYEKFAYNVLDIAIEALNAKGLGEEVIIEFSAGQSDIAPWSINASVQGDLDSRGMLIAHRFSTPELAPALIYAFCLSFGSKLFDGEVNEFQKGLQAFIDGGSAAVRAYKQHGFAPGVRACYDYLGFSLADLPKGVHVFDLVAKLIAYHEVAHAYALQLSRYPQAGAVERRGFELIADLVATSWFYRKMVSNTPDDEKYRDWLGVSSYSESIFNNCMLAQKSQMAMLVLMAVAGAQQNKGVLSLEGGETHPNGFQRHLIQHVHFSTLVASNWSSVLSVEQLAALNTDWDDTIATLIDSGLAPISDLNTVLDPREYDDVEAAANTIEEMDLLDLKAAVPFLRSMRDRMSPAVDRDRRCGRL